MNSNLTIHLVDAFTDTQFKGNPAGVCIVKEYPAPDQMQRLAAYYNWSEIAFVKPLGDDKFYIRWFSPRDEAPICGHASLASAHIIFSLGYTKSKKITFIYKSGTIPADLNTDGSISLHMPLMPVWKCEPPKYTVKELFGIEKANNFVRDKNILIIELRTGEDIIKAIPIYHRIKELDYRAVAITARTSRNAIVSRYFAPKVGILEDPVCGSLHARLIFYWSDSTGLDKFDCTHYSPRGGNLLAKKEQAHAILISQARTIYTSINYYNFDKRLDYFNKTA